MYIFFEIVIFPVLFMIFFYGRQPEKISSLYYIVVYTGGLSLPFIYEIIKIEGWNVEIYFSPFQTFIMIGLFMRKRPVYILHLWLPKAHVEASTTTRMILAGILLKVGLFGIIKVVIFINNINLLFIIMRIIGILIIPIIVVISEERKIAVAYSRITHINFILYIINIISNIGINGSILVGLRHGFIRSMLFCIVGILYNINRVRILFYIRRIQI